MSLAFPGGMLSWRLSAMALPAIAAFASACAMIGDQRGAANEDGVTPVDGVVDGGSNADAPPREAPADGGGEVVDPIGCSDGTREGFVDLSLFGNIAGCSATWSGAINLRTSTTGGGCGDGLGACAVPADACSDGWHLCGSAGDPGELTARMSAAQCDSAGNGVGSFVAALGHCADWDPAGTCEYAASYDCGTAEYCAEPVCCGPACTGGSACMDGAFPAQGTITAGTGNRCGALTTTGVSGVLCCR